MSIEDYYKEVAEGSVQFCEQLKKADAELKNCYKRMKELREQIEREKKQAYWQGAYDVRKELDLGDIPKQMTIVEKFIDYLDEYNYDIHADDIDNYGSTRMDKDEVLDEYIKTLKES